METNEFARALGNIEGKLDSLIDSMKTERLPERVRSLELSWAKVTAVCVFVSAVVPILLKLVVG